VILTYPQAQGIIQTSWNWPAGRKDMEIYGQTGYVVTVDDRTMRLRMRADRREKTLRLPPAPPGSATRSIIWPPWCAAWKKLSRATCGRWKMP
jgi:hypothetical protein